MKKITSCERWCLIGIILLAWGLRWVALMDVPPGWRDDDLIELYTFSKEILNSGPQLYFAGASGHEPLYHTLRAPLIAVAGLNQAAARWQSAVFGTLAVLLTWAIGRRLFTRDVGLLSSTLIAVSFWALMYSRVAIRHIGALPWMLIAIYWGWRTLQDKAPPPLAPLGIAIGTSGAILTYYAGRLIPALLGVAVILVGGVPGRWKRYLLGLGLGILLSTPMFWAASQVPGADARVEELAVPIQALSQGNVRPLLQTTWTTLGMFHAKGDPEWLYNLSERPVFSLAGALLFYLGILTRCAHLGQANARLMLLWLGTGIAPAFISLPPSSLGHTILALPAVYILLAMPIKAAARRWPKTALPLMGLTLSLVAPRDLYDYFITWPRHSMVRFLYRANYRDLSDYFNSHADIKQASISSMFFGPWDKVAVQTDLTRQDIALRWVNPSRALVSTGGLTRFYTQAVTPLHPGAELLLENASPIEAPATLQGWLFSLPDPPEHAHDVDIRNVALAKQVFGNTLQLDAVTWQADATTKPVTGAALWWRVTGALPLPEETLIPNPPPPGVYSGPRLKVFAHLFTEDSSFITGDDGLWVDPYTLQTGDRFVQWHQFPIASSQAKSYLLKIGLYDPQTGERWLTAYGEDMVTLQVPATSPSHNP